jgi:hypothetical protein
MDEAQRPELLLQEALGQLQRTEKLRQREGGHKRGLSALGGTGSVSVGEDEFLAEEQHGRPRRGASAPPFRGASAPRVPRRAALRQSQSHGSSSEQQQVTPPSPAALRSGSSETGKACKAAGRRADSFARCGDCESVPALRWCVPRGCLSLSFGWLARRERADNPLPKGESEMPHGGKGESEMPHGGKGESEMPHEGKVGEEDLALGVS